MKQVIVVNKDAVEDFQRELAASATASIQSYKDASLIQRKKWKMLGRWRKIVLEAEEPTYQEVRKQVDESDHPSYSQEEALAVIGKEDEINSITGSLALRR